MKEGAERDLASAVPLVEKALAALGGLKKTDFDNAKSFNVVKPNVEHVFISVMWLIAGHYEAVEVDKKMKLKKPDWGGCCKMMGNPKKFQDFLTGFPDYVDKGKVTKLNVKYAKKWIKEDPDAFDYDIMINSNGAAAGVADFVSNIILYWTVI